MLAAVVAGGALSRAAAGAPFAVGPGQDGPLAHSNQGREVPGGGDGFDLPEGALPLAAGAPPGAPARTLDALILGSRPAPFAPEPAAAAPRASFNVTPAPAPRPLADAAGPLRRAVPGAPVVAALALAAALSRRRRR